ncbi:hypothetical protein J0X20_02050 [Streptomyces sp. KCTC 0041BP]|uniref:hypothetical protein n=1 Tax=Streptomyces sp. KCTC 0041BP TaxID=201500 RepID=UPI001AE39D10|nr:hypothetical protein [Streptomyces sp. KCTC 0041BP]MBP0932432.1 hypothetical protein [Streptomyces sp. KCTC 0041BP]
MSAHTPRALRLRIGVGLAAALVLLGGAGLLAWWNTDILGQDRFCGDALPSSDVSAVLGGPGRLAQSGLYEESDPYYSFSCRVQRTSKFVGGDQPLLEAELSFDKADFGLGASRLWKNASASSYFIGGATGAVSQTQAWVLLPTGCAKEVRPASQQAEIPVLKMNLTRGRSNPAALARAALATAQHVAAGLGCTDTNALKMPARLQGPVDDTNPAVLCGMKGFQLPEAALVKGKAEPGTAHVTGRGPRTRVCDIVLQGPGEPRISLAVSDDPAVTKAVRRDETATQGSGRTVTACASGDLYVGVSFNDAYRDVLLDQGKDAYETARSALFTSFQHAAGKDYGCPPTDGE